MKFITIISLVVFFSSCNASSESDKKKPIPTDKLGLRVDETKTKSTAAKEALKEEDCDDKAKKPIEIKEDTISLTGNTGCSLDEAEAKPTGN